MPEYTMPVHRSDTLEVIGETFIDQIDLARDPCQLGLHMIVRRRYRQIVEAHEQAKARPAWERFQRLLQHTD